jgi:hypothetical protein
MEYSIEGDGSDVTITVKAVGANQADLIKELHECAEGRCSCPTPQYAKVESIQVAPAEGQVVIILKSKPGEWIEQGDIDKCLEHAAQKVSESS